MTADAIVSVKNSGLRHDPSKVEARILGNASSESRSAIQVASQE